MEWRGKSCALASSSDCGIESIYCSKPLWPSFLSLRLKVEAFILENSLCTPNQLIYALKAHILDSPARAFSSGLYGECKLSARRVHSPPVVCKQKWSRGKELRKKIKLDSVRLHFSNLICFSWERRWGIEFHCQWVEYWLSKKGSQRHPPSIRLHRNRCCRRRVSTFGFQMGGRSRRKDEAGARVWLVNKDVKQLNDHRTRARVCVFILSKYIPPLLLCRSLELTGGWKGGVCVL